MTWGCISNKEGHVPLSPWDFSQKSGLGSWIGKKCWRKEGKVVQKGEKKGKKIMLVISSALGMSIRGNRVSFRGD